MPTKAELYAQMAEKVATQLTGSWQEWAGFLTTASRLYKYPFHEQLMIYAQRPDATACAEYDLWNEKMGRYVRRGSKGIALVDDSGDRPRLRYVFDISDTGTREHSRTPWLWQLEERHLDSVQAMLERTYDVSGDDLAGQLTEVAGKLAEEYWTEHQQDFFSYLLIIHRAVRIRLNKPSLLCRIIIVEKVFTKIRIISILSTYCIPHFQKCHRKRLNSISF